MRRKTGLLLLCVGIPILVALSGHTITAEHRDHTAAGPKPTAAVSFDDGGELFGPSLRATNPLLEQALLLKASGQIAALDELYSQHCAGGREPANPLDQGGEDIPTATPIPGLPYSDFGTTTGFLNNYDAPCPAGFAPDVVYQYFSPLPQEVTASLCGSLYDTKLFVFREIPENVVACIDDYCGLSSQVTVMLDPGVVYFFVIDGYANNSGDYQLAVFETEPCEVIPPPHAVLECAQETQLPSHADKDCDGGCNNMTDGAVNLDRFGGMGSNVPVYGRCFTYFNEVGTPYRDTDWYLFDMSMPGPAVLHVVAEFTVLAGIVNLNDCVNPQFIQSGISSPCLPLIVQADLAPGRYAAFIAPHGMSGVPEPSAYVAELNYPMPPMPCVCAPTEIEPNDDIDRATPIPGPGVTVCGDISHPMDGDYYVFMVPEASALRVHLRGSAADGTCPGDFGLHPYCEILSEDGHEMALCGDVTNQATWFDSDFKFGPYPYYFHVGGADYTTGPYEIAIELIQLPLVSANPLQLTIQPEGEGVLLRWQGGLLPSDMVRIDSRTNPDLPFTPGPIVPAYPPEHFDPGSDPFEEFVCVLLGGREPELSQPWLSSTITEGQVTGPNGEFDIVEEYTLERIEWAVGPDNIAMPVVLTAIGTGSSSGLAIMQDYRSLYRDDNWQAISSFTGHWMNIGERMVLIDYVSFGRDISSNEVGIIDGRGWNASGDTLLVMGDVHVMLSPNNGGIPALSSSYLWWYWWEEFWCPDLCCRLKSMVFCTANGSPRVPPGCRGPAMTPCPCNPNCWLGCPCPPAGAPQCCPPMGPPLPPTWPNGCDACSIVPVQGSFFQIRYCQCAADATPPQLRVCMFMIYIKCKQYVCPDPFLIDICGCEVPTCPWPTTWTWVPRLTGRMRAACERDCELFGPGP